MTEEIQEKPKNNKISRPHDKLFKSTFSYPEVTSDVLKNHLPPEVLKKIDLKTLEPAGIDFITEKFTDKYSDLVFKAKIENTEGYLYTCLEHQSTNDDYMAIRLLEYNVQIIREHMKEFKTNKAPVIINVIIYSGKKDYNGPKNMLEMFKNPTLAKQVMFQDFHIVNLRESSIKKISQDGKAALAEMFLKQGIMHEFCKFIEENTELLRKLASESVYLDRILTYVFFIEGHKKAVDLLTSIIEDKNKIMTLAEQFRREGELKGELKGKMEGELKGKMEEKLQTAKNLIKYGASLDLVKKSTGLSHQQVEKLSKEKSYT